MNTYIQNQRTRLSYRLLSGFVAFSFLFSLILPPGYAQIAPQTVLNLPIPGSMVPMTTGFNPAIIRGITLHPENPLEFDFIVDRGDNKLDGSELGDQALKMIKYFLAALTVPKEEMWVNLSPYEKDRIITQGFGDTEMGRDLLAQDYLLKQLASSLMYPEDELGEEFWERVYTKAFEKFGTTEIPINTFNKVWIVPDKAVVYEHENSVFVINRHLKVMLEEDYVALQNNLDNEKYGMNTLGLDDTEVLSGVSSEIVREVLIPEIEREVNEGKTFANLRQVYNSMILAIWYKQNLKESLLGQVYVDQNKTKGVDTEDKGINQKIYDQYVEAFKKGVYNYIREDYDSATQQIIPRKYFSGGAAAPAVVEERDASSPLTAQEAKGRQSVVNSRRNFVRFATQLSEMGEGAASDVASIAARVSRLNSVAASSPVTIDAAVSRFRGFTLDPSKTPARKLEIVDVVIEDFGPIELEEIISRLKSDPLRDDDTIVDRLQERVDKLWVDMREELEANIDGEVAQDIIDRLHKLGEDQNKEKHEIGSGVFRIIEGLGLGLADLDTLYSLYMAADDIDVRIEGALGFSVAFAFQGWKRKKRKAARSLAATAEGTASSRITMKEIYDTVTRKTKEHALSGAISITKDSRLLQAGRAEFVRIIVNPSPKRIPAEAAEGRIPPRRTLPDDILDLSITEADDAEVIVTREQQGEFDGREPIEVFRESTASVSVGEIEDITDRFLKEVAAAEFGTHFASSPLSQEDAGDLDAQIAGIREQLVRKKKLLSLAGRRQRDFAEKGSYPGEGFSKAEEAMRGLPQEIKELNIKLSDLRREQLEEDGFILIEDVTSDALEAIGSKQPVKITYTPAEIAYEVLPQVMIKGPMDKIILDYNHAAARPEDMMVMGDNGIPVILLLQGHHTDRAVGESIVGRDVMIAVKSSSPLSPEVDAADLAAQIEEDGFQLIKDVTSNALKAIGLKQTVRIIYTPVTISGKVLPQVMIEGSRDRIIFDYSSKVARPEDMVVIGNDGKSVFLLLRGRLTSRAISRRIVGRNVMIAVKSSSPVGGIDLNPDLLDLQIKRDGNGVPLPVFQQPIGSMNIQGFLPVIINVTPVVNLFSLLGLADDHQENPLASYPPGEKGKELEQVLL